MELGPLMEYNKKNCTENEAEGLVPDLFLFNQKSLK